MTAFVRCRYCGMNSSCTRCPPHLRPQYQSIPYYAPESDGCQECAARNERSLRDLTEKIKFLKFNNFFKSDVEIRVQDDVVQAHRFVLADKSIVFRKMFENNMVETETGVVQINDRTLPVMKAVIDFCYNAEITFTEDVTPEEVLKTAHRYEIGHLNDICGMALAAKINNENVVEMLKTAHEYESGHLRDVCAMALVTKINDENLAQMLRLSSVCEAKELREAASRYLKANFDRVFPSVLKEADKSIVFRKMFENNMVETETGVVQINGRTLPVLKVVIDFCRNAEITFTEDATSEAVLKAAHRYEIGHLNDICETALAAKINDENVVEMLKTAHEYESVHLRDVCATTLVTKINDGNLAQMLRLSSVCEAKELREAASQYLKANFDRVFPSVLKEVFSCLT